MLALGWTRSPTKWLMPMVSSGETGKEDIRTDEGGECREGEICPVPEVGRWPGRERGHWGDGSGEAGI